MLFRLRIKKFLRYFIDTKKTFKEILENNFEIFKKTSDIRKLDEFINY